MNSVGGQLDFEGTAFEGFAFLEGERVETTLDLLREPEDPHGGDGGATRRRRRKRKKRSDANTNLIVLTDRRIIHLVDNSKGRESVFASLSDVSAVRIEAQRPGRAAGFVWGGISLLAAALLWAVWDRPVLDVVAAGAVALMGLYIVLDYIMAPHVVQMVISAGSSQLAMGVHESISTQRMNGFANSVFKAKSNVHYRDVGQSTRPGSDADDGGEVEAPDDSHDGGEVEVSDGSYDGGEVEVSDGSYDGGEVEVSDGSYDGGEVEAPDDSSEPSGSDRVDGGQSLERPGADSSPAVGSSGQS